MADDPILSASVPAGNSAPGTVAPVDPVLAASQPITQSPPAAPQPDDPIIGASALANPDDIRQQMATNKSYWPSDAEWRTVYQDEQNQTLGQKAVAFGKGVAEAIPQAVEGAAGSVKELANQPSAAQLGSTAVDAAGSAGKGLASMVYGPLAYLGGQVIPNLYDKATETPQNAAQAAFERWRDAQSIKLAESRSSIGQDALSAVGVQNPAAPLPNTSATLSTAAQLAIPLAGELGGAGKLARAGAEAAEIRDAMNVPMKAAEDANVVNAGTSMEGAEPVTPQFPSPPTPGTSFAGKALSGAGKVATAIGKGASAIGKAPENFAKWLTQAATGSDELAEKAGKLIDLGEYMAIPLSFMGGEGLVKAIGAVKGLEVGGHIASGLGDFMQRLASASPTDPWGKFMALATDETAAPWMRNLAQAPAVQLAVKLGTLGQGALGGGLKAGALGAGVGIASGESPEEAGQTAAGFGVFGAVHGAWTAPQKALFDRNLGNVTQFVSANLQDGVTPETLRNVPADVVYNAAIAEKLFPGWKIRFAPEKGIAGGQAGVTDTANKTIWIDPTQREARATLLHEMFHPIFDTLIGQQPDVVDAVARALAADGKTPDQFKQAYGAAVSKTPGEAQAHIANRDAQDKNWWVSEILSEAGQHALYGKDLMAGAEGQNTQATTTQLALQGVKGWLSDSGVKFNETAGKDILPDFKNTFASPELRKLAFQLLKTQRKWALSPNKEGFEDKGTPLTTADVGTSKMPFYQTPQGQQINPYGQLIDDGKGGKKFVAWPASEVRRRLKAEQGALDKYFPKNQPLTAVPEAFWNDPSIPPWTKAALENIFANVKTPTQELSGWYHRLNRENSSTSDKSWAADVGRSLGNVSASLQSGFPLAVERTKNGNLIARWASMEAARQKATRWAERKGELSMEPVGGDLQKFWDVSKQYLQNHAQGQPGESNGVGTQMRDWLNAFWFGDNKEFQAKNPLRASLQKSDRAGVFRSLRVDRMESLHPAEATVPRPEWEKGKMNFSPGLEQFSEDAAQTFFDRVDENRRQIMHEFLSLPKNSKAEISWTRVSAEKLQQLWLEFGKRGSVRDIEGIDKIAEQVLENIARLRAATELAGHTNLNPKDFLEDEGIFLSKTQWDKFYDSGFLSNKYSDYAMRPLEQVYSKLYDAKTSEEKIYLIDRALNIVHRRGDIADLFVQGGVKTLNKIASQGGYQAPFDRNRPNIVSAKPDLKFSPGYSDDYSKSNNALNAEAEGRFPATEIAKRLKVPVGFIKEFAPNNGEWHHTSKFYNVVQYYDLQQVKDWLEGAGDYVPSGNEPTGGDTLAEYLKNQKDLKENPTQKATGVTIKYLEWGGTRNHPHATERTEADVTIELKPGSKSLTITRPDGTKFRKGLETRGFEVMGTDGRFTSPWVFRLNSLFEQEHNKISTEPGKFSPAAQRLQELSAKPSRTSEEEKEFQALRATSAQNNSREAFERLQNGASNGSIGEPKSSGNRQPSEANRKITAADLQPALMVNGKPVTGGNSHAEIAQNYGPAHPDEFEATLNALMAKDTHVFVDKSGKVYSRAEASKALGLTEPLQSHTLAAMKNYKFSPPSEEKSKQPFYSQLEKVVGEKFQGKQMPAAQLAAMLRNPQNGVKADELKWSGLDDFLKGKSRVTREEVQNFLAQNNVKVKEITKGGGKEIPSFEDWVFKEQIPTETEDERKEALDKYDSVFRHDIINSVFGSSDEGDRRGTKFENYQLPGGENYREILFQLPENQGEAVYNVMSKEGDVIKQYTDRADAEAEIKKNGGTLKPIYLKTSDQQNFTSSHWDEPNVLAHARINDREDAEGKPGLFAEELQSDWHQTGRKEGYAKPLETAALSKERDAMLKQIDDLTKWVPGLKDADIPTGYTMVTFGEGRMRVATTADADKVFELYDKMADIGHQIEGTKKGVPDAPLRHTWHETVFRRLVRMAAEENKDWLGWTTGEQQAERYELSKQIDSIAYKRDGDKFTFDAIKDNSVPVSKKDISIEEVEAFLGKEIAEKMLKGSGKRAVDYGPKNWRELEGVDLKVGGEGMKGFYDKILVDYATKFGKKFGAKVEERKIPGVGLTAKGLGSEGYDASDYRVVYISHKTHPWAIEGKDNATGKWDCVDAGDFKTEAEANKVLKTLKSDDATILVHSLPITPEMKKSVLAEGVALFSPKAENANKGETNLRSPKPLSPARLRWLTSHGILPVHDFSKSQQFSPAPPVNSPEFKQWFANSKVTDKKKPLVVFHGTPAKHFEEFQIPSKGKNSNVFGSWDVSRFAAFFTPNEYEARGFASQGQIEPGNIRKFYLSLQNPVDLTDPMSEALFNNLVKAGVNERWLSRYAEWGKKWPLFDSDEDPEGTFVKALQKLGYDGAKFIDVGPDSREEFVTYAAFQPHQIKEVTEAQKRRLVASANPHIFHALASS